MVVFRGDNPFHRIGFLIRREQRLNFEAVDGKRGREKERERERERDDGSGSDDEG